MALPRWVYGVLAVFWLLAAVGAVGQIYILRDEGQPAAWWWIPAYAAAGFAIATLFFGVYSFRFGGELTRDPNRQAQNATRAVPIGLAVAAAGSLVLGTLGPSTTLAVCAGSLGGIPVIAGWRAWFDHSAYARRRWPGSAG